MASTSSSLSLTAAIDSLGSAETDQVLRTYIFYIGTIIIPVVSLSGIVTNIFNLIILRTEKDTSGSNISLINLAVAGLCYTALTAFSQIRLNIQDSYVVMVIFYLQSACNVLALIPCQAIFFFMCKITLEQYISITLPLKSKQFLTAKSSRNISFALWFLALLTAAIFALQLAVPYPFLVMGKIALGNITNVTMFDIPNSFDYELQTYINLINFYYFIFVVTPLRTLILGVSGFCTVSLVFALRRQNIKQKSLTRDGIGQRLSRNELKVARIGVALGFTLMLYSANAIIYVLCYIICYSINICGGSFWFNIFVSQVAGVITLCNCSISFFVYMKLNKTFRKKFYSLFPQMPGKKKRRREIVGIQ